ncbi:MAG TPA: FAD-dependent oxidoreductase [Candidatus Sulfotelmatobacter sp.]|nr:FAD-dependent oxidoreductase [Candidatus Sulfotelmatobacter sp.]
MTSNPNSRRDFIKFVVAGSVAAGCPIERSLVAEPCSTHASSSTAAPQIDGEHFEICHEIRDGHGFDLPAPRRKVEVVIVGAGSAGLSAAYFLRGKDFLLLEKEDHFGGNAYQEEFDGQPFATGSAYAVRDDEGDQLAREIGLKLLPVDNPDPTIVNKTFVADTWIKGIDELPYPKATRAGFRKFRDDIRKIDAAARMKELDAHPFAKFTAGYAPEVQQWWDGYGPSNWGAICQDTSAYCGITAMQDIAAGNDSKRVILPGGLGCITHKLVEVLQPKYGERMLGNATVIAVVSEKDEVKITYMHDGNTTTVSAKAVLMCTPKHITARLVRSLPDPQKAAMHRTRFAPYPVVNIIFDKPVYNRGYDSWCPGNTFTDFIVADWTVRNQPDYKQKNNILSFYTPLREPQRATLLDENACKILAARVFADFQKLMPEFNVDPIEVRIYRRGHPMFMSVPGQYTVNRIAAAQPMDRVYFGNADSGGPESLTSEAVRLSKVGAEWLDLILAGKPGAKALVQKALEPTAEA